MKPAIDLDLRPLCYTIDQVAAICQVQRDKVVEWTHRTGFPVIRESGTIRIPVRGLIEWLDAEGLATNERPAQHSELARLPIRKRPSLGAS